MVRRLNNSRVIFWLIFLIFLIGSGGGVAGTFLLFQIYPDLFATAVPKTVIEERKIVYVEESSLISARQKVSSAVVSILGFRERISGIPSSFFIDPQSLLRVDAGSLASEKQSVSAGTGFIIGAEGLVLTNKHVVSQPDLKYSVILNDGTEYRADVVSRDPLNDLAVLQMYPVESAASFTIKGLSVVELGDSDILKIGQQVLAIGNALAEYQNTTTAGIISATGRQIQAADTSGRGLETLSGLIQTDAAINLGNSGGPLVNLEGQVIGMNTAVATSANGIGFAIPINDVKPVLLALKKYGKIVRPVIGVRYTISREGAMLISDQSNFGVIPDGPAAKAGLIEGDIITEVDMIKVDLDHTLQRLLRNKFPEDKVQLKILRNGEILIKEVVLGSIEDEKAA